MLSMKVKYGLQALLYLVINRKKGNILSAEIAEANNLPKRFLDAILQELAAADILYSKKGRGGGYHLNRTEASIMVGEVITILDGAPAKVKCTHMPQGSTSKCPICQVEQQINDATAEILDNTSLLDLAANPNAALQIK